MMNVLFCFDRNYEQHFGVAVTSLILNNAAHLQGIYIITDHISPELKAKLEALTQKHKVTFYPYEIDGKKAEVDKFKIFAHVSAAACYRLLIAEILPPDLEKVLYLDSDLVVNGDLSELYNLDVSNYPVAAFGGKVRTTKQRLQLKNDYYFNSGVLLINLNLWRQQKVGLRAIDIIKNDPESVLLPDQDAINKVVDGNFLLLDKKWNSQVDSYEFQSQVDGDSVIVHYIGSLKPWQGWCMAPEKDLYWSYLKKSPWSDAKAEKPKNVKKLVAATRYLFRYALRKRA
ncbi:MAG: glycosyltransferase family 8 protein [Leptolyngbyaceae cyanobacterium bins.59]|nr:glycosyltransferase family 8 protein [Leptolyngbyaceae cyanobacterium bins.59]